MRIRLARAADGECLAEIYRPAVAERATSFELVPPTGGEMGDRVARTLVRTPWLVAERAEASPSIVGYAYAGAHKDRAAYQWSVDVSVYVHPEAHRCGVGRALYEALFQVLRTQRFVNAYAGITLPNPASEGFHRALGFEPVGVYRRVGYKFGAWHDVLWLSLALTDHAPKPDAPRALPDVVTEVEAMLARWEAPYGSAADAAGPLSRPQAETRPRVAADGGS